MPQFRRLVTAALQSATPGSDVIQDALGAVRKHLGMEAAYLSEFVDDRSVFRRVDAPGWERLIKVGDSHSLEDVYCQHIVEGRLPELIPDTGENPLAQSMPITKAVPIGSHASIPIRLPDGNLFGMFCCLSSRANPSLSARDLETMRVFAELAAKQVYSDLEAQRLTRERRTAIERLIDRKDFEMAFQPIFNLLSMQTVGVEALCRFKAKPYRSPDQWFKDAAHVDMGTELELNAIAAAVRCFKNVPAGISMSVNASPETIVGGEFAQALATAHLERTVVEITEHAPVKDYEALHRELAPLRARGVQVAVDDAGAGYSGLQHIVQMAPDIIKMDMSLTRSIDQDGARRALASAMIFYARETGSVVVAEGIETAEELATLKMLGVSRGQGYLLGKPSSLTMLQICEDIPRVYA